MPYRAAIFDLDGTLVDSLRDLADTANQMLAESGYPIHPVDAYRYFVGDGLQTLIERISPAGLTEREYDHCLQRFKEIYPLTWRRNSCPYPGIHAMLAGLKNAGLGLAVLSNKPHSSTLEFVDYFFPGGIFPIVFGQRPEVEKKPSPAGALEIATNDGCRPCGMSVYRRYRCRYADRQIRRDVHRRCPLGISRTAGTARSPGR